MIDTRTSRMSEKNTIVWHKMMFFFLVSFASAFDGVVALVVLQLSSFISCNFVMPLSDRLLECFSSVMCIWSSLTSFRCAQLCSCFERDEDLPPLSVTDGVLLFAWEDTSWVGGDRGKFGLVLETTQTFPFLPKTVALCRRSCLTSTSCSSRLRFLPMFALLVARAQINSRGARSKEQDALPSN